MKHSFEKWMEEEQTISDESKNVFQESVSCQKIGAYRSAIVMGMIGFTLLMRDRVVLHREALKKATEDETGKKKIDIKPQQFLGDDNWDSKFTEYTLDDEQRYKQMFPNKLDWHLGWKYWRGKRNVGAHGKSYALDNNDVEALYSWIKQAYDVLHPFVAPQVILDDLSKLLLDQSDGDINEIASRMLLLDDRNDWQKFTNIIKQAIQDSYEDVGDQILELFNFLYNEKTFKLVDTISECIIKAPSQEMREFLTTICCQNTYYAYLDDGIDEDGEEDETGNKPYDSAKDKQGQLVQLVLWTDLEVIDDFLKQGAINNEFIEARRLEDYIINSIKSEVRTDNDFDITKFSIEFQNIYYDIMQPIYKKLTQFDFDDIRVTLSKIAKTLLRPEDVELILSLELNTSSDDIKSFLYQLYKKKDDLYPNVDFSQYESEEWMRDDYWNSN